MFRDLAGTCPFLFLLSSPSVGGGMYKLSIFVGGRLSRALLWENYEWLDVSVEYGYVCVELFSKME